MTDLTVRAPAKINLHLGVGAPRPDGFHPLVTVFHAISLYDDLSVAAGERWQVDFETAPYVRLTELPEPGSNIVDVAARRLARHHGLDDGQCAAAVSVFKSIPIAGGMAGGSADAAAALVALDRHWDLQTSDDELLALAAELGSDVPFSLVGGTALGTGRGEVVEPVADSGPWWWVVVPSAQGLSTPAVYRRHDELRPDAPAEPADAERLLAALRSGDPRELAPLLHNDLQAAALDLRPDLADLIDAGERAGALRGLVSGSGPTVVFLATDGPSARRVAGTLLEELLQNGDDGEPTVLVANGPAAGAHLVANGVQAD